MNKIDIEKWKRKAPELPEDFFNKMQEKVLAETTQKKEPKLFNLVAIWSSVAAVLVFGGIFFLNNDQNEVSNNDVLVEQQKNEIIHQEPIINMNENTDIELVTTRKISNEKVEFTTQKNNKSKKIEPQKRVDIDNDDWDRMLNAMTESEIRDLAVNYEQDTFLELY